MATNIKPAISRESRDYIIAYLDVLGIKSILKSNPKQEIVSIMGKVYSLFQQVINDMKIDRYFTKLKIFSDNIILVRAVTEEEENKRSCLHHIIAVIEAFQLITLLSSGLLLRGGVTIGKLYIDDVFALGDGLARAYELEDTCAIYPRIIIDEEVVPLLYENTHTLRDKDGFVFIDFLSMARDDTTANLMIERIHEAFEKGLHTNDLRVIQKVTWLVSYCNDFCEKKGLPSLQHTAEPD